MHHYGLCFWLQHRSLFFGFYPSWQVFFTCPSFINCFGSSSCLGIWLLLCFFFFSFHRQFQHYLHRQHVILWKSSKIKNISNKIREKKVIFIAFLEFFKILIRIEWKMVKIFKFFPFEKFFFFFWDYNWDQCL